MTAVVVALVLGAVGGRLAWLATRSAFDAPLLARSNWRGRTVPTGAGVLVAVVALAGAVVVAVVGPTGARTGPGTGSPLVVLVATVGFCLLGALDDLAGTAESRGFRGHLRALARGRVTTGAVKMAGGGALALACVAAIGGHVGAGRLVADAALVALCANLANLLDRAPGRAVKAVVAGYVAVAAAAARRADLVAVAVVVGAAVGLLPADLREELMLGDAGANALGGALGLGIVLATGPRARTAALVAVAALNLAGELVSFSRVINAVPALRALDRAGRRP
ncbi:MAG: hypothetical protein ABR511_11810 [Acidimicrobiales bacterium]